MNILSGATYQTALVWGQKPQMQWIPHQPLSRAYVLP